MIDVCTTPTDLAGLAVTIAPELPGVYVLPQHELPERLRLDCLLGHANPTCNIAFRDALIDQKRWVGPQPVIVLNIRAMEAEAANHGWDVGGIIRQVFIHELAHVLPLEPQHEIRHEPPEDIVDLVYEAFADINRNYQPPFPWEDHDLKFIRTLLHLEWRATAAGYDVPLIGFLFSGWDYSLSAIQYYHEALGDEPQRMAGETFATIEGTLMPIEFCKLFTSDVERYLAR